MPEPPRPPDADPQSTVLNTKPPRSLVIGPYHLVHCIGQGGMGEVWLADQTHPIRRRVAVKLIKAGMNTREFIARFESERQALALMDHPAIAKVFDAGSTSEGIPYFVMEYISGVPITEYCDQHRLTVSERLALFVQVCDGVQHAHHKAIIHRDLKPSNILITRIDDKPMCKIIDFGVARAISQPLTAGAILTRVGSLIGTPEYMSPEQADSRGEDIDTRTDVYSLGVILYELLVGALPVDFTDIRSLAFHEFLRRIREEDAPRPSTKLRTSGEHSSLTALQRRTEPIDLSKQLTGDLDAIALKALEKERSRRYGSPSDLAGDIQRYLNNEAVLAVSPSLTYLGRKFIRRHRLGVTASGIVALAVLALVISLIVGSVRIASERDRANREAQAAEHVSNFLIGTFKLPDPEQSRGNQVTAREILDKGALQIETELAGQPSVQARLMTTMGDAYVGLGLYPPARRLLEKAVSLQQRVIGFDGRETLASQRLLARTLEYLAEYDAAEKLYQQTLQKQEHIFGPTDIETLRTKVSLGTLYNERGRYSDAESILTEVLKAADHLPTDNPTTLSALHSLAISYDGARLYAKEVAVWEDLYRRRLQKLGPDHPDTISSMQNLAYAYFRQGKNAEAERLQRQGLERARRVQGNDHPNVFFALGNLANTLVNEGRANEAEPLQREALEGRRRVLGPNHPETLFAMANMGGVLSAQKRYREAETLYRAALQAEIKVLGDRHPEIAYALYNLGAVEAAQGKRSKALIDLRQAIDHGYADPDEIAGDASWSGLRGDSDFEKAIALIKSHRTNRF